MAQIADRLEGFYGLWWRFGGYFLAENMRVEIKLVLRSAATLFQTKTGKALEYNVLREGKCNNSRACFPSRQFLFN